MTYDLFQYLMQTYFFNRIAFCHCHNSHQQLEKSDTRTELSKRKGKESNKSEAWFARMGLVISVCFRFYVPLDTFLLSINFNLYSARMAIEQ